MQQSRTILIFTAVVLAAVEMAGCLSVNSPIVQEHLKTVSAGHTGCLPQDNVISNVNAKLDGSGTWNATCKGRTYLCSASGGDTEAYSCALAEP